MMSKGYYIYALIDPRDGTAFYIGKTTNPAARMWKHRGLSGITENAAKKDRVRELLGLSLVPQMQILEEVSWRQSSQREIFWIREYASLGHHLTNIRGR